MVQIIDFGSELFDEALAMRYKVLREPLGLDYSSEDIAAESEAYHFAYISSGEILGYCQMKSLNQDVVKMRQVAVSPSAQGKGVGKAMVDYVEAWARLLGYKTIELHARESAVDFYLKSEYIISKDPFEEVGIPHRYMSKEI